jgi:uncharacterized protein (TIGR02147 family)
MKHTIFQYKTASRFLLDRVVEKQKVDPSFSIRKWAKEMGFPSHSLLAMVLQGKRNLTLKQVPFFAKGLNLSTPEKMFFQGLIQVENARTKEEKDWCEVWLSELRPQTDNPLRVREVDEYVTISDWIHPALLALSDTRDSFRDAEGAAKKLESNHTATEMRVAIERLVSLNLLKKDVQGLYRATTSRMTTKDDIATRGVREYHKQCASLANEKIDGQNRTERELQSMAIAIPTSRLPLAKELIRKFRSQFTAAMASEHSDQVYQFNLHFFRLTEAPSELPVSKEIEVSTTQEPIPSPGVHHEISH